MQNNGIDSPLFVQFFNEEVPKVKGYIPLWTMHSKDLRERAIPCGREDFSTYARLIDEYIEVLRAFSNGHPIPASLGGSTLKILELLLCKIFMEVSSGIQPMLNVPQARARPHGKLDRPKMGKQMHELLTRGKVPPATVTLLVSLRRQCKGAIYEPDTVVMMQQATKQALELCDSAMGLLWKHVQFSNYNQRPDQLMTHVSNPNPYQQVPATPLFSPPPPMAPTHFTSPPTQSSPYAAAPAPAYTQPSYPPQASLPPPGLYPPAASRPVDYQGPPLGNTNGANPQPVQALPNPYANIPAKPPPAAGRKPPARPPVQLPADYQPSQQQYAQPAQAYENPYAGGYPTQQPPPAGYVAPPVPQRPGKR